MKRSAQSDTGWVILAGLAAFLVWLLSKGGNLLHETVSSGIVTSAGTIKSDPVTGAPLFDTGDTRTYDVNRYAAAVPPPLGWTPGDMRIAPCPQGYQLFRNSEDGSYWCFPT